MTTIETTTKSAITAAQVTDAVTKSITFSNVQDVRALHSLRGTGVDRGEGRISAFMTAVALELDLLAPGVFEQIQLFLEDVAFGRNPLPRQAAANSEQTQ